MDKYSQAKTSMPFKNYQSVGGLSGWLNPECSVHGGRSDAEIIKEYVSKFPEESLKVILQGREWLESDEFDWKKITVYFNRYFQSGQEAIEWFKGILKMIEEERKRQGLN